MKVGLEMEFWTVDDRGALCDGRQFTDAHEHVEGEFVAPMVEVATPPAESVGALREELLSALRTLLDACDREDVHVVPLGTPLTTATPPATTARGELYEHIYGSGVRPAKNCAGAHVHFDKGAVTDQLNLLTALDPALALVSSSPYYCGRRVARSARALAYRQFPGEEFRPFCDLWAYADNPGEWADRVDRRFSLFTELAAERGVDPSTVEEHFDPEDTVLAPVRLRREKPTVEWRAPDTTLPSELLDLVGDVRSLVAQTERKPVTVGTPGVGPDRIGIPEFEELRELSQAAIERGLEAPRVREYLRRMGFDTRHYRPRSRRVPGRECITERRARRVRLACARRLREDVEELAGRARSGQRTNSRGTTAP